MASDTPPAGPVQPNILFIQADQMTALALRAYGNPTSITPKLDQLAGGGVVFENAYCNFPLCAPSRYSMMTGRLASKVGAYDNGAELAASSPTMAHYLRNLGYRTALSGKMHFCGPDQLHGYEARLTSDIYPSDFSWSADWQATEHTDLTDTRMVTKSGLCEDSVQLRYDTRVTQESVAFIKDHAANGDGRPLFLTASYTHPHDPFVCTEEFWSLYDDVEIPMPEVGSIPASERDGHSLNLMRQAGLLSASFEDHEIRRARRGYYGAVSFIDAQIAQLCAALEEAGLATNTIIVFTSDHGEMLGERGMWLKKNFFEPAMRVPLIVHYPASYRAGRVQDLVSLVDLLPSFAAMGNGGEPVPACGALDGESLVPLLTGGEAAPRAVFAEILSEGVNAPAFMIRRGDYKYIHSGEHPAQMFHLPGDPQELSNLICHPDHAEAEAALRAEVAERWDEAGLTQEILGDQQRRLFVQRALEEGRYTPWDHDAGGEVQKDWFRGQTTYNEWAFDYTPAKRGG